MGGIGSGRHYRFDGKDTVDAYRQLDVRKLARGGWLEPGLSSKLTWRRGGEVAGSIDIRAECGRVMLDYRARAGGGAWEDFAYSVSLVSTPCHLGGERRWFLCPAVGCGRRVAVLYGGRIFACRHCHRLAYPSQRESTGERASRRAERIRDRLGWESDFGPRPKGMHRATYDRLCDELDRLDERTQLDFIARARALSGLRL